MSTGGTDRNPEALAQIERAYSDWGGGLLRFALRLCGNRDDAEDVVVETFASAYRQWHSFRGSGSRRAWLYGIAVNCYRMSLRKRGPSLDVLPEDMPAAPSIVLDSVALHQAIARLPLNQRAAFLLVKSEGLTCKEAAEVLNRPLGTVLYEVHQAVHAIRRELTGSELEHPSPARLCEAEP